MPTSKSFIDDIDSEMAEWFRSIQNKRQEASSGRPAAPQIRTETKTMVFDSVEEADRYLLELRSPNNNSQPIQ